MGKKFLYGASVQGIQSFIFQTDELKDIVGASELVEQICTTEFAKMLGIAWEKLKDDDNDNAIVTAAGNIKYVFEDEQQCRKVVRDFPKKAVTLAPGITISQAMVTYNHESEFSDKIKELEERLKIQRNRPTKSLTMGLMGMARAPRTGLPAVAIDRDGTLIDKATQSKRKTAGKDDENATLALSKKSFGEEQLDNKLIAYDIDKITGKNNWIAVIHIDGNGLGQIVQRIGKCKDKFRKFSLQLDEATIQSANEAYKAVKNRFGWENNIPKEEDYIPIRPIVLGGDDHTLICRADLAIEYTKVFMEHFEKKTGESLGKMLEDAGLEYSYLTACAGIAFIKSNYPFHYGCDLAEALCKEAKKDAKMEEHLSNRLPLSALMFHKVQDSFIENYEDIVARELTPGKDLSFEFGPYYLKDAPESRWTIDCLTGKAKLLNGKEGNAVKSHLRQWMSTLHNDTSAASQKRERVLSMLNDENLKELFKKVTLGAERDAKKTHFPVYDLLSLHSIEFQTTNPSKV